MVQRSDLRIVELVLLDLQLSDFVEQKLLLFILAGYIDLILLDLLNASIQINFKVLLLEF